MKKRVWVFFCASLTASALGAGSARADLVPPATGGTSSSIVAPILGGTSSTGGATVAMGGSAAATGGSASASGGAAGGGQLTGGRATAPSGDDDGGCSAAVARPHAWTWVPLLGLVGLWQLCQRRAKKR